jgi:hypothetical protein
VGVKKPEDIVVGEDVYSSVKLKKPKGVKGNIKVVV